jgi:hypothetical protein
MPKSGDPKPVPHSQKTVARPEPPWNALPPKVAEVLRPDVPATAEEIIDAIREAVPAYARPLEGAFGQAMREGVELALSGFLDDVEGKPREETGSAGDMYFDLGRGEAREGRTMEALLRAYRVGGRVAWRRASATGRAAGFDAETLSLLAEAFFVYIDELSARSAEGFVEEQSAVAGEAARRQRSLLTLLIQEPPAQPAVIEAAAREAAWELPATLAALLWRDESEQPVARRLPMGSLAAALDDGLICALVPDPDAPGRRAELERALGRRHAALGSVVSWQETWQSARRARAAHRLMAEGAVPEATLVLADDHLGDLILHADGALVGDLIRRRLAPLEGRSRAARQRLQETLAAWLEHHGSVREVAEALHVHPQTVRYRLAQLREVFGEQLEDPQARFELELACRAAAGGG